MIFSAFSESIGYTSADDLRFSKEKDDEGYRCEKVIFNIVETPKTELPLIEGDETEETSDATANEADDEDENDTSVDNLYDEAIITANEIARLIRDECGRNGEPLRGGDIAVLVRSHRHAKPLTSALRKLNIKYTESSKKGLSEDKDMQILVDLLSSIDNPRSDIPLSRFITADTDTIRPIFSFEEIVKIRTLNKEQKERSLYDSILNYIDQGEDKSLAERCSDLETLINRLRNVSSKLSAEKFLQVIASLKDFAELCRTDAFVYLYDCACRYVKGGWNGLYNFVKYLKSLIENGESGKEPDRGDPDAVTIMTVHQSKGLEFNTCFVFGTGKQFNTDDTKNAFIFSKELGLSVKLPPEASPDDDIVERASVRYADTITHFAGKTALKSRLLEEEARILYVALTRARERLYVSGTLSKSFTEAMEDAFDCPDTEYGIRHSKNYLTWMLQAVCNGDISDFCKVNVYKKGQNKLEAKVSFQSGTGVGKNATKDEKEYAALMSAPCAQT
jgi:ATP-dependent helicase/nuclease subunit A